jgi:NhaP-type Na+/H+ or K+/H+ antiporter
MSFLTGMMLVGGLALAVALGSAYLRHLPLTTSVLYLIVGVALGPVGLGWVRVDLVAAAPWLERLTEIAVIVSLFVGGLTLRLPLRDHAWRAAYLLAGPVMVACIAGVAAVCHLLLGLPLELALLVGAVLAPTDPVLASAVSVNDARDDDRMRYGLSGEAGFNDGMAFPFVVFALLWITHGGPGTWITGWALHRLAWAVPAGLVAGFSIGWTAGHLAFRIRHRERERSAPSDLLAIAVIALSYTGAEALGAWGFLAAFAAGLGMRQAERDIARRHADDTTGTAREPEPAEHAVAAVVDEDELRHPVTAAGATVAEALALGHTIERLFEAALVVLVGAALVTHWDVRGLVLAALLMGVIRPLTAWVMLGPAPVTRPQRALMSWFGIRGIGSLYYLAYAIEHGLPATHASIAADLTVVVILVSVVAHGVSGQPLIDRYERRLQARRPCSHRAS